MTSTLAVLRNEAAEDLNRYMVANTAVEPVIVQGRGATVTDERGTSYLDLEGGPGVVSTGHCHPKIVKAVQKQAGLLMQSPGRFYSRLSLDLARRLSDIFDGRLARTFFANSGAEANDGAIKLAMKHATLSGKLGYAILAFDHGFHGRLSLPLSLTGLGDRKKGFGPYASFPGIVHLPTPYSYRYRSMGDDPTSAVVEALDMALRCRTPGDACALISEPVWAVGGVIVPPKDFWPRIAEVCRKHDIPIIFDEVFTGFGRTGRMFAHMHSGVEPDIVTFAKAIGGGIPMAGYIASEKIGTAIQKGEHFTTFGANNQLGAAAGHAVLDVLAEERLPERAEAAGERFLEGLRRLSAKHACIGEVRGLGLMLGIEVVGDASSREPAPALAKRVQALMLERGVLIAITGSYGCVLRITPPLVISNDEIDRALAALDESFGLAAA